MLNNYSQKLVQDENGEIIITVDKFSPIISKAMNVLHKMDLAVSLTFEMSEQGPWTYVSPRAPINYWL